MRRVNRSMFQKNLSWQMLGSVGQIGCSALILVVLGRGLGVAEFGLFSIIMGIVIVGGSLFEPRMQDIVAKQFWTLSDSRILSPGQCRQIADLILVESIGKIVPFVGLILFSSSLAHLLNLPTNATTPIGIAALGMFTSRLGMGVSLGLLRVSGRSDLCAYSQVGEAAVRLILLLCLVATSTLNVTSAIIVQSLTATAGVGAQWLFVSRNVIKLNNIWSGVSDAKLTARLRPVRRLLFSNLGLSWTDLMNKDLDVTLISPFLAIELVGLYKMAKNVTLLIWRAVDPFFLAMMPELSRLTALGQLADVKKFVLKSSIWLCAVSMAVFGATYTGVQIFGVNVFGNDFAQLSSLLPLMAIGMLGSAPLIWGHPLAVAIGRPDIVLVGSLASAIFGVGSLLVLVPPFGVYGAAIGWSITFLMNFAIVAIWSIHLLQNQTERGVLS